MPVENSPRFDMKKIPTPTAPLSVAPPASGSPPRKGKRAATSVTARMPAPAPAPSARWNNALASTPDPHALRKRALILAAGRVFGDKGFHNTTLDHIAGALSVTKPALYRYVQNKHEILYECHRMAVEMAEEALNEAVDQHSETLDVLRAFVALYIGKMTSELGTCVMLTEYYSMTPEHSELIQQRRRVLDRELRDLVVSAMEEGAIAPCDPKLAVFFFMGAINSVNRWFSDQGPSGSDDIAEAFAEHTVQSLRPLRTFRPLSPPRSLPGVPAPKPSRRSSRA